MSASASVYVGAAFPESLRIDITPSASLPDLSVVTAASIRVTRPQGANPTALTWTPTLSGQSPTTLALTYPFAIDASDVPLVGSYLLIVTLTTPGGTRRCKPMRLNVQALT